MTQPFSFDEAVFRELESELGPDDTVALLSVFLTDTAKKLIRIEAEDQTRAIIKREAHSMKSSAATFGFRLLSQTARQLEASAEAMPQDALRGSIGELRQAFEATRTFADRHLLNGASGAAA
jgi:HPt (histidine-containing phosphotransfer) domain-containing protein